MKQCGMVFEEDNKIKIKKENSINCMSITIICIYEFVCEIGVFRDNAIHNQETNNGL